MATMVLTAVGSALGGPIGGAIGAVAGQWLDRAVIGGSARRDGPRLTELKVQTSRYGSPIPQLFGRMRVAGTVIWATELIERRQDTSAGKGGPTVTQYSYAASLAVLLSGRPILGVGRIWADGKLLRGAAGDLKAAGRVRVHLGHEDQAPDPLIASAEGRLAPAHRGQAYAVFEELALADFGNRIPSLTFEVIAHAGPVPVDAIARALVPGTRGEAGLPLDGFAAEGQAGAVVAMLAEAAGGWLAPEGPAMRLVDGGESREIADRGWTYEGAAGSRERRVGPAGSVPRRLQLAHYDPARDWQAGVQHATRSGAGTAERRIELPAAVSADTAKGIAEAMLARAGAERTRRTVGLGLAGWALVPGAVVAIAGETGRWRVERVAIERGAAVATLVPLAAVRLPSPASGGRVAAAPDLVAGATVIHAVELPHLGEGALVQPQLTVVAAGTGAGWRRAALLVSLDDGASWEEAGATAASAVLGTVLMAPGSAPAGLVDRVGSLEVEMLHPGMQLHDADAGALDRGGNLALVGDELLQFERAEPLGGRRWRLSGLWRGRRGTEAAIGIARAGTRFVMIEAGAVRELDLPLSALGGTVRVMAVGIGDEAAPPVTVTPVSGASVAPPSPVGLVAAVEPDGAVTLGWTRRSRAGWRWLDGVDAPLGEEREGYRVTIDAGDDRWDELVDAPRLVVSAERRRGRALRIAVRQRGSLAESPPAWVSVMGEAM